MRKQHWTLACLIILRHLWICKITTIMFDSIVVTYHIIKHHTQPEPLVIINNTNTWLLKKGFLMCEYYPYEVASCFGLKFPEKNNKYWYAWELQIISFQFCFWGERAVQQEVFTDTYFDGNLVMDEASVQKLIKDGTNITSKKFKNEDR